MSQKKKNHVQLNKKKKKTKQKQKQNNYYTHNPKKK